MHQADTLITDEGMGEREKEKIREALRNCAYPEGALQDGEQRGKGKLRKAQEP